MSSAFLSPDWYRVASLKLRKRTHVQIARHVYRSHPWYVVQDLQAGKFHRLSPQSFSIFSRMNGDYTVHELWELACSLFPEAPPSQTEIIQLLSQLHNADLVSGDKRPNMTEINRRTTEENRKTALGYFKNPLSVRIPIFDPEPYLRNCLRLSYFLFSPLGAVLWVLLMISATVVALMSWSELEAPRVEAILSADNIAFLAIAYIIVKLLHEIGHGLAIKRFGGEVRELGVMMLVFFPVPYVDASQSAFFVSKYQRMLVSAAGVIVELAIAAAALIVWTLAEEGTLSTLAYNLFLIGGISTLLFNGNPLLRFDGYFVFADFIESPNLGQRSNQYFWYICQKFILGHSEAQSPVVGQGEEKWLLGYSILAFLYRMFVMVLISLYVASAIPVLGVAIVLWSIYTIFIVPIGKGFKFLTTDPKLDAHRTKAIMRFSAATGSIVFVLFFVPFPHTTVIDAVLDTQASDQVRVTGNGFVSEILVRNGAWVESGDEILRLNEPLLENERSLALADLEDARLRLGIVPLADVNARTAWQEQVAFFEARLIDLNRRDQELSVKVTTSGILALPGQSDLIGRLLQQGEVVGSVLRSEARLWRAAAPADRTVFIDTDTQKLTLRISTLPNEEFPGVIVSRSPEVTTRLDSFALTNKAGGRLVVDPQYETPVSLIPVVNYIILKPDDVDTGVLPSGTRATVRIVHSPTPLAPRIWRSVRQTFLLYFGS